MVIGDARTQTFATSQPPPNAPRPKLIPSWAGIIAESGAAGVMIVFASWLEDEIAVWIWSKVQVAVWTCESIVDVRPWQKYDPRGFKHGE
jgi:hypothetical protein